MKPLTEKEWAIAELVHAGVRAKAMLPLLAAQGHHMALPTLRTRIAGIASKVGDPHSVGPMAAIRLFMATTARKSINVISETDDARRSKQSVA